MSAGEATSAVWTSWELAGEPASEINGVPPCADDRTNGFNRYLLSVEFEALNGERWAAVGGGETVEEAIAAARECCPEGSTWKLARWNDLWGS